MAIGRTNCGVGGGPAGLPQFTYTGDYILLDDGNKNWRIKFLTSGTLTFEKSPGTIDVFCVGGGGAQSGNGAGGGGGYTTTQLSVGVLPGTYEIVVGSGGTGGGIDGSASSAFNVIANGGKNRGANGFYGGHGGSGGGGENNGQGGSDGSSGSTGTSGNRGGGGNGQGTTTREFGESNGTLYSGGGGASNGEGGEGGGADGTNGGSTGRNAEPNTGGGGGAGKYGSSGGAGGSGIVVIRNTRG